MDNCNCDQALEYLEILKAIKKDLLMRADEDCDGCNVVNLSSSLWIKLSEVTNSH